MATEYDLIIIGAGPAGAMAAKTAGENGLKVALLERRTNIAKITRPCTEGLLCHKLSENGAYVKVNFRDKRIVFPLDGLSIRYDGPVKGVHTFIIYSGDGHTMEMRLSLEDYNEGGEKLTQHVAVDKEVLVNDLLNEARDNHVEIFPGVNVHGAEKTDEGVIIHGHGRSFEGSFALAADGVNSLMARHLGFNKERKFFGTLTGKAWHMQDVQPPDPYAHIHIVEGVDAPPLFCICPRAVDEYFVMVGGYTASVDCDARLHQIMKDSWFSPWFTNAEIVKEHCCVLNLFSPIAEPFRDNVLLIGDACSCAQISTHNAILSGWKAANAITYALINRMRGREAVSGYLTWWKKNFYDTHHFPPVDFMDVLTREEVNVVCSLFKDPIPASARAEDAKKIMAEAMAKIMVPLQTRRPDIFTKIKKLREVTPEETWAERRESGFPNR